MIGFPESETNASEKRKREERKARLIEKESSDKVQCVGLCEWTYAIPISCSTYPTNDCD